MELLSFVPEEVFRNAMTQVFELEGQIILSLDDWSSYTESSEGLNGRVILEDERTLPIVGGRLLSEVGGIQISNCLDVEIRKGLLNGAVRSAAGQFLPVIAGVPIQKFDKRLIQHAQDIQNVEGTLNGKLKLDGLPGLPVLNGDLITSVEGYSIHDCRDVHNTDGKLSCVARFANGEWLAVVGGKILCELEGQKVMCSSMRMLDGELHALVSLDDGRKLPVVQGKLVTSVDGEKIVTCSIKSFAPKLTAAVMTTDGPRAVVDGHLWRFGQAAHKNYASLESIAGRLSGAVQISETRWLPILDDRVIEAVQGEPLETAYDVRNIAGKLCCGARLQDGTNVRVLFGEIVEHSL
jgi:hypothetical protein